MRLSVLVLLLITAAAARPARAEGPIATESDGRYTSFLRQADEAARRQDWDRAEALLERAKQIAAAAAQEDERFEEAARGAEERGRLQAARLGVVLADSALVQLRDDEAAKLLQASANLLPPGSADERRSWMQRARGLHAAPARDRDRPANR